MIDQLTGGLLEGEKNRIGAVHSF